jgi:hypothetical protein
MMSSTIESGIGNQHPRLPVRHSIHATAVRLRAESPAINSTGQRPVNDGDYLPSPTGAGSNRITLLGDSVHATSIQVIINLFITVY